MIESFWSTMQRELLDTRSWENPEELGAAIFEWIEAWYNPRRRHTAIGTLSPVDYEHHWQQQQATAALHTAAYEGRMAVLSTYRRRARQPAWRCAGSRCRPGGSRPWRVRAGRRT
jgi:hypothetical protein